jgi:putative two-component system response regulator
VLNRGGFLHDIGKIGIPDRILLKPGRLNEDERRTMQSHTTVGESICRGMQALRSVCPIVRHHHEHLDGSGYPDGLRGDDVPLLAQIMGIVDVYDALTMDRPYRAAVTPDQALVTLRDEANRGWYRHDLIESLRDVLDEIERGEVWYGPM